MKPPSWSRRRFDGESRPGPRRRLHGLALLGTVLACAPARHTVEPYRSDPDEARALEARAEESCRQTRGTAALPEKTFVTDGCSAWPDAEGYVACCVEHDILYWCGGSAAQRLAADDDFGRCVAEGTSGFLGSSMRLGVRLGGHPIFPTHYRWGYGDAYRAGYPDDEADP